jgi:hypothetical protein
VSSRLDLSVHTLAFALIETARRYGLTRPAGALISLLAPLGLRAQ